MPDEVRKYVLGYYGEIAGPIDLNLYDRIARGAAPTVARPGDLLEPGIPRVRRERGPFASDDDLLLAAFYSHGQYKALKAAGPIKTERRLGLSRGLIEQCGKGSGLGDDAHAMATAAGARLQ